jgi:glucokinase
LYQKHPPVPPAGVFIGAGVVISAEKIAQTADFEINFLHKTYAFSALRHCPNGLCNGPPPGLSASKTIKSHTGDTK